MDSLPDKNTRFENIILVADDDQFIREVIKKMLGDMAAIISVPTGGSVVESYKTHAPDVVFLDVHLPERDGFDLLSDLRAEDPEAFVVMISGDNSQLNITKARQKGAQGYITKPFEQQTLLRYLSMCKTFLFSDSMVPTEFKKPTHPGGTA